MKLLHTYHWLIFTSVNGVQYFFSLVKKLNISKEALFHLKIAVVGTKTEKALKQHGFQAEVIPETFVAEDLSSELMQRIKISERVLFPKGNLARNVISSSLREQKIDVTEFIVYENVMETDQKEKLKQLILDNEIDIVTFTSSSTVTNFMSVINESDLFSYLSKWKTACIGPICAKTAAENGLGIDIVASTYTIEGLIEAIITYIEEENK